MHFELRLIIFCFCFRRDIDCYLHSVVGTIADDTSFFYEKFQTPPSRLATFEYSVLIPLENNDDYVNFYLYTSEHHVNLEKECSVKDFGQVKNDKLHQEFSRRKACYQRGNQLFCHRVRHIQDYIPRHFAFSLGFYCEDRLVKSLKGFTFNVTIFSQTNETTCSPMPETAINCAQYYSQVSHPNLINHEKKEDAVESLNKGFRTRSILRNASDCYQHFDEFACYLFFPRCNATFNSFIVPCRETYEELTEECLGGLRSTEVPNNIMVGLHSTYDYEYLPSRFEPFQCYYEEVRCKSPPNVTDAEIVKGKNESGNYAGGSMVEYSCIDDSKEIVGNSTVRCLYNGRWSTTPVCKNRQSKNNILKILLSILFLVILCPIFVIIVVFIYKKRKGNAFKNTAYKRQRQFDAFVCYDFDENNDFVMDMIKPELEENHDPPFNLCIHSRDFHPGLRIFDNIQKAIVTSNSAIMVMSQAFVNSIWCKAEFEQCFMENLNDPAFKLFVIMMQPANTLVNLTEYIRTFIEQKTYLERNDPELFQKIANHLTEVKKPEEGGDANGNDNDNRNEHEVVEFDQNEYIELADIGPV